MILIIPVRYAQEDPVWSRELFVNWMQPLRPFSLGHYWTLSSRGFLDVSSDVLDPVVITNPVPVSNEARDGLHRKVVAAATEQRAPKWADVDLIIIWFARPTGWWGGSEVAVPVGGDTRNVRVTVVDSVTPFDAACQELGHGLGFLHEWAADDSDYGSPYSTMSAQKYGTSVWQDPAWVREPIAGLPDAEKVGRTIGPLLPAAQMYGVQAFRDSAHVVHQRGFPFTHRLYALDYQLREPEGPLPVVIAVPSNRRDGRMFFLELRRRNRTSYDNGIGQWKDTVGGPKHVGPDEAVVVHSRDLETGRVRYEGTAPLHLVRLQPDWPFPVGDFTVRVTHVDTAKEFVDVEVRAGSIKSFPIRGVLLAGRFRTQEQLNAMSRDDMRNTLIVEMTAHSNQNDYQRYDNDTLAGMGALMVFLRRTGIRDDVALAAMSADDQRNTAIVELNAQTGAGRELQGRTSLELAQIALGRVASPGHVPGVADHWVRGVLLLGGFRTQHQLNAMSNEDMRNTLIVVMTSLSNQNNYQGYNNLELAGVGAVMVFLRETGVRDDAALQQMSADDQRNTAIVVLDAQTGRGQRLQGLSNLDLVKIALGVERV
ncbi:hypothetical protein [Lentzea guizhouensis]|nr:hypothetical protein [Lentzea guizhouensis]